MPLSLRHPRFRLRVDRRAVGGRVGCDADRFAGLAGNRGDLLPQLFGDERDHRVGQPQDGFEHADQRAAGAALLGGVARLDLHLRDLQVPVAELVPDELVDRGGDVVQAVLGEALGHVGFGALERRDDPVVGRGEGVVLLGEILAFAVHQHEPRGVPELVAEVAVALAALGVEIDVAAEAGVAGHGEPQRVRPVRRHALRELLAHAGGHLGRGFGPAQAHGGLVHEGLDVRAFDQVHRVDDVALGLAHLLAFVVPHHPVDIDVAERHLPGEMRGHHDHAGNPEEDDLVARHQHRRGQVQVHLLRLRRPPQRREGHQGRGVPGVQHVLVAPQLLAGRLGLRRGFVDRHVDLAVLVVPGRDLVAPPQLARDAPVLDVVHPLVVGVDPVLRHEAHRARLHGVDRLLRDRLAGRVLVAHLAHRHEPLVGQHGLDDLARALAARHHELVLLRFHQQAQRFQVGDHLLAGHEAVEAAVFGRRVVVDLRVQREHADDRAARGAGPRHSRSRRARA